MTVATVKAQLATLQAAIPGIRRAYAQLPRGTVNDADLPLFLNFAREAAFDWQVLGSDTGREGRLYVMTLLVLPAVEGIPGEGENLAEPWITTVRDYFAARPQLGQLQGVQVARMEADSGPRQITWGDTVYWGIEFRLRVSEYFEINYANYE